MAVRTGQRAKATAGQLRAANERLSVLMEELRQLLDEPAECENRGAVLSLLDKMLANLQAQFNLQEQEGYLAAVLEQFPSWHPQVEHLQQQHRLLHRQLREIRERIARDVEARVVIREVRRQLRDWMQTYQEHDRRESDLLQEAFILDTGVGE